MKNQFSVAMLSAVAFASSNGSNHHEQEFMGFIASNGKHYDTAEDMAFRLGVFTDNQERVEELNRVNTGVSFGMNFSGDMTDSEWAERQGLDAELADAPASCDDDVCLSSTSGRHLQDINSINWVTNGKVGPVKSQGQCGSCWSFAATTTQEAVQAIHSNTSPVRLSEQEGVDCCTNSHGCNGGWMDHYWAFSRTNGSQSNSDYSYEAATRSCRNQSNKTTISAAASWQYERGVTNMQAAIQNGPMSIAVSAGSDCWRFYEGGILTTANNCTTRIDHGVVVVGLVKAGDGGNDDNDGGDNDNDATHTVSCRVATRTERRAKECEGFPEVDIRLTQETDGRHRPNRECCTFEPITEVRSDEPDHWIIQNSWGANWGENGFIRIAVDDSTAGISGMNQYAQSMTVKDDFTPPAPAERDCTIDEGQNHMGPNRCTLDSECSGDRTCSQWNWCQGTSNC